MFFLLMEGKYSVFKFKLKTFFRQTPTVLCNSYKACIHLSISNEDYYGMWNIIIQKLESAADTKPDNKKQDLSRISTEIFPSKTEARILIRRDCKLISDSHFRLYLT